MCCGGGLPRLFVSQILIHGRTRGFQFVVRPDLFDFRGRWLRLLRSSKGWRLRVLGGSRRRRLRVLGGSRRRRLWVLGGSRRWRLWVLGGSRRWRWRLRVLGSSRRWRLWVLGGSRGQRGLEREKECARENHARGNEFSKASLLFHLAYSLTVQSRGKTEHCRSVSPALN